MDIPSFICIMDLSTAVTVYFFFLILWQCLQFLPFSPKFNPLNTMRGVKHATECTCRLKPFNKCLANFKVYSVHLCNVIKKTGCCLVAPPPLFFFNPWLSRVPYDLQMTFDWRRSRACGIYLRNIIRLIIFNFVRKCNRHSLLGNYTTHIVE